MSKIKDSLSLFVIVNASALYIIYFIIKNLSIITASLISALSSLLSALTPLFAGLIIAYIVSPLTDFIDDKVTSKFLLLRENAPLENAKILKTRYLLSIFLTFALLLLLIIFLIYSFSVLISGTLDVGSIGEGINSIISYFTTLEDVALEAIDELPSGRIREAAYKTYDFVLARFSNNLTMGNVFNMARNLSENLIDAGIGLVISIYLLKDKEYFKRMWRKLLHLTLPQKQNALLTETLHEINDVVSLFIRGAGVDALIVALLSSALLSVYGLPFSVFIGCFSGVTNIIPYFGPLLGVAATLIVGTLSGSFTYGLGAAVLLFILQQIDCNIIYPKIVGRTTGLHPLFVLLSVSVAGYYAGIIGMILAVPIAGVVKVLTLKFISS